MMNKDVYILTGRSSRITIIIIVIISSSMAPVFTAADKGQPQRRNILSRVYAAPAEPKYQLVVNTAATSFSNLSLSCSELLVTDCSVFAAIAAP